MRKLLVSCAAAGSLLLGTGAAAAGPALAQPTSDSMTCLGYTFANGVCNLGQAQAGQGVRVLPRNQRVGRRRVLRLRDSTARHGDSL